MTSVKRPALRSMATCGSRCVRASRKARGAGRTPCLSCTESTRRSCPIERDSGASSHSVICAAIAVSAAAIVATGCAASRSLERRRSMRVSVTTTWRYCWKDSAYAVAAANALASTARMPAIALLTTDESSRPRREIASPPCVGTVSPADDAAADSSAPPLPPAAVEAAVGTSSSRASNRAGESRPAASSGRSPSSSAAAGAPASFAASPAPRAVDDAVPGGTSPSAMATIRGICCEMRATAAPSTVLASAAAGRDGAAVNRAWSRPSEASKTSTWTSSLVAGLGDPGAAPARGERDIAAVRPPTSSSSSSSDAPPRSSPSTASASPPSPSSSLASASTAPPSARGLRRARAARSTLKSSELASRVHMAVAITRRASQMATSTRDTHVTSSGCAAEAQVKSSRHLTPRPSSHGRTWKNRPFMLAAAETTNVRLPSSAATSSSSPEAGALLRSSMPVTDSARRSRKVDPAAAAGAAEASDSEATSASGAAAATAAAAAAAALGSRPQSSVENIAMASSATAAAARAPPALRTAARTCRGERCRLGGSPPQRPLLLRLPS